MVPCRPAVPSVPPHLGLALFALFGVVAAGCGSNSGAPVAPINAGGVASPTPRPSVTPTIGPSATPTAIPSATPVPTATPTPTPTPTPSGARPATIYLGNTNGFDILSFPATATGNVAPARFISGADVDPYLIYLDTSGQIWSVNRSLLTLTAYAPAAGGNATPTVSIGGSSTEFTTPIGVYVTTDGTILVTDVGTGGDAGAVLTFASGSNGNVAPSGVLAGANTTLATSQPCGIWLDSSNNIYLAEFSAFKIVEFAAGATGNVAPINTIGGSNTQLNSPFGLTLDAARNIYVANAGGSNVLVFAPGATGNVAPTRVIGGANTQLETPFGVAVDSAGYIYVADASANAIFVFAPGANGNVAPVQAILGSNTGINAPRGIAVR
jgi:sugar lactone lactonase YvrE